MQDFNLDLLSFIENSPSVFHSVKSIETLLNKKGFTRLKENENWSFENGKYYCTRNNSSIIAFDIPKDIKDYHFQLCLSHDDSPTFKLKDFYDLNDNFYLKLNVESYGGAIYHSWFDKPLTIAGRLMIKEGNKIVSRLVYIDKDLLMIPSVPIHFNREVNNGYKYNVQVDLCPLVSAGELNKEDFLELLAKQADTNAKNIIGHDLYLVNRQKGCVWGAKDEFISSPKLDDLQAAYTSLRGFLEADNPGVINIYGCFDNEETGSSTKQGAGSSFLIDVLSRINNCLNKKENELISAIAKSFAISFDNAHALHPNHPEIYDKVNRTFMNKGVVIKEAASGAYTTDAFSRAVFKEICAEANIPVQSFANKSDARGGSTLGHISLSHVSLHSIDIGLAQLAMHSSYETAGSKDSVYAYEALKAFYSKLLLIDEADGVEII